MKRTYSMTDFGLLHAFWMGWLVMVTLGALTSYHPGYWTTVVLVFVARLVFTGDTESFTWKLERSEY